MTPANDKVNDSASTSPANEALTEPIPAPFKAVGAKVAATKLGLPPAPATTKLIDEAIYPPIYPTFTIVTEPADLKYSLTAYGV